MASNDVLKRAVMGFALVALLAAMHSADAQRRRLPSRTEPIPDTETEAERKAIIKEAELPNPGMMIYGPPVAPLGAPPVPAPPEPVVKPAPVVAPPPAPVAAPAPVVPAPAPAPVVTPTPPAPAPVAVPIPAPTPPPAPVAAPAPPPVPAPAPVAVPAPVVTPPPAPVVIPAPVLAPRPAPVAAPKPVAPPPPPVAAPAPIVVPPPAPVAIPKPAPVPERREVARAAPTPQAFPAPKLDAKLVEQIFSCMSPGLPQDWKRTWVVVGDNGAAKFFVTSSYRDEDAEEFTPCNAQEIARQIVGLSTLLPAEQRNWRSARLAIDTEGRYELNYER